MKPFPLLRYELGDIPNHMRETKIVGVNSGRIVKLKGAKLWGYILSICPYLQVP